MRDGTRATLRSTSLESPGLLSDLCREQIRAVRKAGPAQRPLEAHSPDPWGHRHKDLVSSARKRWY